MRRRTHFSCTECGTTAPRWLGRCPGCGAWNTLVEEAEPSAAEEAASATRPPVPEPIAITDVESVDGGQRSTGVAELDRVLGGGVVAGSVILLSGEPGVGKSTLLLQVLAALAAAGDVVLLATAEESAHQVRLRAERLGALSPSLKVLAETVLPSVLAAARALAPTLLVVDSIQTVYDPGIDSAPGSVAQVREGAAQLVRTAKEDGITTIVVGHVTKEGTVAGPRLLEHLVDTVLTFEGDAGHALRMLRATKHRFGSTGEVGIFEMRETGLVAVEDPSQQFLADRWLGAPGSAVACVMEGSRPLLVEVQALVPGTAPATPRRSISGLDAARVGLLAGVLEKRYRLRTGQSDLYAQAAGGVRVAEPGADLAIALALASAVQEVAVDPRVIAVGEVGLSGEVRRVTAVRRRLAEAARLGFTGAIVPAGVPDSEVPPGIEPLRAADVATALSHAGVPSPRANGRR